MKKVKSWKFGNTKKEADYLLKLVISKKKKATSSLYFLYKNKPLSLPKAGDKNIITDSKGQNKCLIKITKVTIKPFSKINSKFAYKEGEGNKTLDYWKRTHKKFFIKTLKKLNKPFNEDILIVCEEFKVLKIIK